MDLAHGSCVFLGCALILCKGRGSSPVPSQFFFYFTEKCCVNLISLSPFIRPRALDRDGRQLVVLFSVHYAPHFLGHSTFFPPFFTGHSRFLLGKTDLI